MQTSTIVPCAHGLARATRDPSRQQNPGVPCVWPAGSVACRALWHRHRIWDTGRPERCESHGAYTCVPHRRPTPAAAPRRRRSRCSLLVQQSQQGPGAGAAAAAQVCTCVSLYRLQRVSFSVSRAPKCNPAVASPSAFFFLTLRPSTSASTAPLTPLRVGLRVGRMHP